MVRVLVVDDSMFMRRTLVSLLEQDPNIKVVETARNGEDALQKLATLDCDVITLDVEMPRLNGLETLKKIMAEKPLPVLMVSSLTEDGAETTLKALEHGAMDFIPKIDSKVTDKEKKEHFGRDLRQKVLSLARRKIFLKLKYNRINRANNSATARATDSTENVKKACKGPRDLVVIGVSTGGPPVVQKILSALPEDLPACILVAQHMPATFTGPFAKRLDSVSKISVSEAEDGDKFKKGHAYICPGGKHIGIKMRGALPEIAVTLEPKDALYKPTVNVLMGTAGQYMAHRTLGVMLTGMGSDGIDGAKLLKQRGGCLIAQSEASCVVYGMSKAVIDADIADLILDADEIAQAIIDTVLG